MIRNVGVDVWAIFSASAEVFGGLGSNISKQIQSASKGLKLLGKGAAAVNPTPAMSAAATRVQAVIRGKASREKTSKKLRK